MPAKKKATKKSATKKTTAKTTKKTTAKKEKKNAAPHEFFFFADGRAAKNIKEMAFMLDDISHDVFNHHVNPHKNDLAEWVKGVFDEKQLADVLAAETEIAKIQVQLFRHLAKKS